MKHTKRREAMTLDMSKSFGVAQYDHHGMVLEVGGTEEECA